MTKTVVSLFSVVHRHRNLRGSVIKFRPAAKHCRRRVVFHMCRWRCGGGWASARGTINISRRCRGAPLALYRTGVPPVRILRPPLGRPSSSWWGGGHESPPANVLTCADAGDRRIITATFISTSLSFLFFLISHSRFFSSRNVSVCCYCHTLHIQYTGGIVTPETCHLCPRRVTVRPDN